MNSFLTKRTFCRVAVCCFVAVISYNRGQAAETDDGCKQGLRSYENNEIDKAIPLLKTSLAAEFAEPATAQLQKAADLAKSGNVDEAEKLFLSLLDDEKTAARARYELGLIYENKGQLDQAAAMFYKSQVLVANKSAAYVGAGACKKCHFKQYTSWKKTKMAETFEVLKPGVRPEAKTKANLDPQKDYTKDAKCLECHTTGFGMPGGYRIPVAGNSQEEKRAQENEGTTCEACHGPGSKYVDIHKDIMDKERKYSFDSLRQAGQHNADVVSCTVCHNRQNPTAGPDFHFDYEEHKEKDTHENSPLKYREKE